MLAISNFTNTIGLVTVASEIAKINQEERQPTNNTSHSKILVLIDAGHGGIDTHGKYTTAPAKMYQHPHFTFFEGVYNRQVAKKLAEKLQAENIDFEFVHDEVKDLSLTKRCEFVNKMAKERKCIVFSIHANAHSNLNANYFSVWTSKGQTESDIIASTLFDELKKEFPNEKFSTQNNDGDNDFEENFAMVAKTICPAVLSENGFFTNEVQATKMLTDEWQEKVAKAHFQTILKYIS